MRRVEIFLGRTTSFWGKPLAERALGKTVRKRTLGRNDKAEIPREGNALGNPQSEAEIPREGNTLGYPQSKAEILRAKRKSSERSGSPQPPKKNRSLPIGKLRKSL